MTLGQRVRLSQSNGLLGVNKRCTEKCLSLIQMGHERAPANRISVWHGVVYNIAVWHSVIPLTLLPHSGRIKSVWVSVTSISLRHNSLTPQGSYTQGSVVRHGPFDDWIRMVEVTSDNWPLYVKLCRKTQTFPSHLLCSFPAFDRANGKAKPGSTWDVWDVHIIREPLVPPVDKEQRKHRTFTRKGDQIAQVITP